MKNKKQEYVEKEAGDNKHQMSGASEEEFMEYVLTALGRREWLFGAM
ncbi:MAG: hypothetical protein JSW60_07415 [Thermoplasmatales archaeon]|nr:MAG: hypothetical protein JSW60_07415 [Thermoplasmatales archaeon]